MRIPLALSLMLLATPVLAQTPEACPVDQYFRWDKYEELLWEHPKELDGIRNLGYAKVFDLCYDTDVSHWWTFAITPETEVWGIALTTDEGVYEATRVIFATERQTQIVSVPAIAHIDYERVKLKNGELRVVAFAQFDTEPKGKLVSWKVVEQRRIR